jgi:hypothetical protein
MSCNLSFLLLFQIIRQEVFSKYYPQEEFENFSPYFEDDEIDLQISDLYDQLIGDIEKDLLNLDLGNLDNEEVVQHLSAKSDSITSDAF